jgi:hypothetical protein
MEDGLESLRRSWNAFLDANGGRATAADEQKLMASAVQVVQSGGAAVQAHIDGYDAVLGHGTGVLGHAAAPGPDEPGQRQGVEQLHRDTGRTSFSFTRDAASAGPYPENWQKTLGAHQVWSSGHVTIDGDRATMTVTVHAEDRYNFNRGDADIASGAPDNENGRFAELGWAKSFDVSGGVTRTVSWDLGSAAPPVVTGGDPTRDLGGEDRVDGAGGGR